MIPASGRAAHGSTTGRSLGSHGRVLVVMPAWNEEQAIEGTIRELREAHPELDVLVVDDGSRDGTAVAARRAGAQVCQLPFNLGVGGAMRTGYRYAVRHGYDVAVQVDADGQHDPTYLLGLLERLDDADLVIGARFAGEGDYSARGPRRWAMVLLAAVLSRIAGTRLTDVTSGFRAANARAMRVFADHYPAEYLGDTVESLVIASRMGCRVRQVPVGMRERVAGRASQNPFWSTVYLLRAVMALFFSLVRRWPTADESRAQAAA